MTHGELVARAQRWLRVTRKHPVVLSEIGASGYECPDVIGWSNGGCSTLIECKVSRSDFLVDGKKTFRKHPEVGMGAFRWYAITSELWEKSLVIPGDLPERWGLVAFYPKRAKVLRKASPFELWNRRSETSLLVSAVRRATEGWGRKVFGEISPLHGQLDPHPTVAANLKAYRDQIRGDYERRRELEERLQRTEKSLDDFKELLRKAKQAEDNVPFG